MLTSGDLAMVDDEDFGRIACFPWCLMRSGALRYATCHIPDSGKHGGNYFMHRLVMGVSDSAILVDHRDGNGLNCQKVNLRLASNQQNQWNGRKRQTATSKFKGVCYRAETKRRRARWRAHMRINGKITHLGQFKTEIEAARAYDVAALQHFGEFALLNFPQKL